mgnify:CR=1 FL=1
MSLPSPFVVACFPLQQQIIDKITGAALSNGSVRFFSDFARTVTKDVYTQSFVPSDSTYNYTNLGISL